MRSRVRTPLSPIWGHLEGVTKKGYEVAFYDKGKRSVISLKPSDIVYYIDLSIL